MKLKRLEIQSLPGIEKGFVLNEIDEKVNLVTGANGIGKSSLIRALKYLLNETDKHDPVTLNLSATLQGKHGYWEVQRSGSAITWEIDGKPTEKPSSLPKDDQLYCYWLTLEDFLLNEQRDEDLVAELKRELNGGFDLVALRKDDAFIVGIQHGIPEKTKLGDARKALKSVIAEYDETRQIEEDLPEQQEKVRASKAAKSQATHLQSALNLLEASQKRSLIENSMAEFPDHMDQLTGDEIGQLRDIGKKRKGFSDSKEANQISREKFARKLEKTGLTADLESLSALLNQIDEHLAILSEIKILDTKRDLKKEALDTTKVNVTKALEFLGGDGETVPKLDPESLSEAQKLARKIDAAHGEKERLQQSQEVGGKKSATHQRALAFIGFGGLIATGTGLLTQVWPAALGGSIVLTAAFWMMFGARDEGNPYRQKELKDNEKNLKSLEEEKQQLAKRLGFDPSLTSLALAEFIRATDKYTDAYKEQTITEGLIVGLNAEIDPLIGQVRAFLNEWNTSLSQTTHWKSFSGHLDALKARRAKAAEATQQVEADEAAIESYALALTNLNDEETEIYNKAKLEPGELAELNNRCGLLPDWQSRKKALVEVKVSERERKMPIENQDDLLSRVVKNDYEGLVSDLEQAKGLSEEYENLNDDLSKNKAVLDSAGNDQKLEEAVAVLNTAKAELDAKYQKALVADTAEMLLDTVQEQYRNEHEPGVLRDARQLFLKFTHHKFDLDLDEDKGFTARDLKARLKPQRELSELSSATRMQLLLAMRVAWTLHLEQGHEPLPLFLDEALTTADHERFGEIAETLEGLAKDDGRQIFYLCARQQEADYWEHATGNRPHHIDLDAVRSVENIEEELTYQLPEATQIPRPDGLPPEEYAKKLKVPAIDLRQSVEGIHIFHLLRDDLYLLHDLIEGKRITTLGQFDAWLKNTATKEQRDFLQNRSAVAGLWAKAWHHGRGKPVDRIALENASTSTTFIDKVSKLNDSLNGDGDKIVAALREGLVKGFRHQKIDDLEEWLDDNGYIDAREELDLAGRERFVHLGSPRTGSGIDIKEIVRWLEAGHKEL